MAANTIDNGQCEAPPDSKETPGNVLVTVQGVPDGKPDEAASKLTFKRFEDLPEMVEMLSPLHPDDEGDKTDVENLSDHEAMDTADQRTVLVDKEEDSGDENKTDVEDLDIGSVRRRAVSQDNPAQNVESSKGTAKRFIEEVQLDNLEHKKISGESRWVRNDSNHIGQKPSHSRQRSHSQPCSLSSPGPTEPCQSPRSASSESEFANLSAHVRAVLGELDVRSQKYKFPSEVKRSKLRCPSSGLPYRLTSRSDQERLLKKFFVEEDVGSLTDEGEFVIMPEPRSPTCRLTAGLEELDVSSEGTDIEDLAVEPSNAIGSGGEWTETDPDSGEVRHIISKTTHTTVTSVKPDEGAPRGDTMSTSISQSSKGSHGGSTASAPSRHDEAESLTFFQKKEFFEKLSEQAPLQDTLSSRLGSTPTLDTALTRPVVTVKPRPRSESLTSQGEIIEENIVFAERLRLFQNGAQASSSPGASLPHLDLVDQRRQSREQRLQGLPETVDSLQQQFSEACAGLQDTKGKSDTRLLVHTSDADKEAVDVCSVQSSEDLGDQQFSRMRVRMPATEECVGETLISSCDEPGEKPSPLRDAYKDSLLTPQEGSQTGGDHWMEAESALDDSSRPVTATRVITTRTTRTVGPDGREQLVTTTTEEGAGGDEPELRLRRSMQGVLDSFMADPSAPPPHSDEE